MKRILLVLALFALLVGTVYGAAAQLDVDAFELQAGGDDILICDDGGVDIYFKSGSTPSIQWDAAWKDYMVHSVVVAALDCGCDDLRLTVDVTDKNGNSIATGTMSPIVRPGDCSTNPVVPITPHVRVSEVYDIHVLLQK